jgi:hypothetical protein
VLPQCAFVICSHHSWAPLPILAATFRKKEEQAELCILPSLVPARGSHGSSSLSLGNPEVTNKQKMAKVAVAFTDSGFQVLRNSGVI